MTKSCDHGLTVRADHGPGETLFSGTQRSSL
jgi:hypothetical protein